MKIQYGSDLHLEWGGVTLPGGADVLVLAGDIAEAKKIRRHKTQWEELTPEEQADPKSRELYRCWTFFLFETSKYEQVFMVTGNHEAYHGRFDLVHDELRAILPSNVRLVEKEVVEYGGVVFLGATMWTDCNRGDAMTMYRLKHSMNDYRAISNHYPASGLYHKLTPQDTAEDHFKALEFFREELPKHADRAVVVITHHAPSFKSISEQYIHDREMNGGYASDLSDLILDHPQIKNWLHGHCHSNSSYDIGSTRVLCNPRGYKNHEQQAENWSVESFEIGVT